MDKLFDIDLGISTPTGSRYNPRAVIYALRLLLSRSDIMASVMEDCESVIRLLGKRIEWPADIMMELRHYILQDRDDDFPVEDPDNCSLADLLKTRHDWTRYERVMTKIYAEDPKYFTSLLEDVVTKLTASSSTLPASRNASILGKLLGLSEVEMLLLDFADVRSYDGFRSFLRSISSFPHGEAAALVAASLSVPAGKVRAALRANAPLRAYGLIHVDNTPCDLEDYIRLDNVGESFLLEDYASVDEMLESILSTGHPPTLTTEDYPHLQKEYNWLSGYLRSVTSQRTPGANILLYGPPGTGKTEFARLLANSCGISAYEIKSADNDGDPVSGKLRLSHYTMSQRFLAEREGSFIIFDEIEDVFPDSGYNFGRLFGFTNSHSRVDQAKAWMNHQLESSPVPAIWISNSIDSIDEAFLRRFAFHLEFRTPPKTVRERLIRKCIGNVHLSDQILSSLASDATLSPAQISQASRFASLCSNVPGSLDEGAFLQAIRASQTSMGRHISFNTQQNSGARCDYAYLNLDSSVPVASIERSLQRYPTATMCFYGIPGAGKTSLARHLADSIGRPLLVKRASDLLGMYVGQSEKNIARMFAEARNEGAVLVLDEADSFLRSRQHAERSWEVTQVNELLQQMEAFDGVFICTTNLMDDVDEAALRRFTFKIRFEAMTREQRMALFAEMALNDPNASMPKEIRARLETMDGLAPGDFATVRRQELLMGEHYLPLQFLEMLEQEFRMKTDQRQCQGIGFVR